MSTMIGATVVLPALPPESPRYSLMRTADQFPAVDHWEAGAGILGYAVGPPSRWDAGCLTGTFRVKDDPAAIPAPYFLAFQAYQGIFCTAAGTGAGVGLWEEYKDRASAVLLAAASYPMERQLAAGDPVDGNPYLGDSNMTDLTITPGTPVSAQVGLGLLEQAIGATGVAGMVHFPPEISAALSLYVEDAPDGTLRTIANGTPVAVGGGYSGVHPVGKEGPEGTQAWAFASGPVGWLSSALIELAPDLAETMDRSVNDIVYRAELDLLVAWDTQLQAGVLIDWSL